MTILIKNGLIVTGDNVVSSDILIKNGKIAEIASGIDKVTQEILDATGRYILPGGVDASVHLNRDVFGISTADNFESGTKAAALGGTTTIMNYVFSQKGSYKRGIDEWLKKAEGNCAVDFGFHLAMTATNERALSEIPAIIKNGITSFICYYSSRSLTLTEGQLYSIMKAVARENGLVGIHLGSGTLTQALEWECAKDNRHGAQAHAFCRPPQAEGFAAYTALTLAEMSQAAVCLLHLSSAHALEKLKIFRDRGNPAFGETCPHYLLLSNEKMKDNDIDAAKFVCSPPLRGEWHMDSLWRGIRSGDIQMVSSDHMPFRFAEHKAIGKKDFRKIPSGIPSVEHRLLLIYGQGVASGRISLTRLVQLTAANPAKLLGIYPEKGTIAIGSDADLVILNPESSTVISADTHHMNVDYTPYEGLELKGAVERVFLRGKQIVKDGQFVPEIGDGKFLKRAVPIMV